MKITCLHFSVEERPGSSFTGVQCEFVCDLQGVSNQALNECTVVFHFEKKQVILLDVQENDLKGNKSL